MSSAGADLRPAPPGEWKDLELSVRRLLDRHEEYRQRALQAERRVRELQSSLEAVSRGELDPDAMAHEIERLRNRNLELDARLEEARAVVHRLRDRLGFLQEDRG